MKKISMMVIALLAAVTMSANKFAKVTVAPADWSGQYLIAYHTDSVEYVFNCKDENNDFIKAYATNDTIVSDQLDNYVVELAKMTSGYSAKIVSSDKYMSGTSGSNTLVLGSTPVLNTITFNKVDSIDLISNTSMLTFNSTKGTMRFRYYKPKTVGDNKKIYCHLSLYKAQTEIKPEKWIPDTLSVTEARQLITDASPLMDKSHYIKGVVAKSDFGTSWPGWAMIWMTDIDNPTDSLEGYKIYKDANSTQWASASEIPCGLGDTIMLFADGLGKYKTIYETTSGYFVEVLGKATTADANSIYNFAVGAVEGGYIEADKKYLYELILSRTSVEGTDDAMHFKFKSYKELGIAGKYSIYADGDNASYDDIFGAAAGSLEITYMSTDSTILNHYNVKSVFKIGDVTYTLNKEFDIAGYYSDYSDQFLLGDDLPWVPDTVTVSEAIAIVRDSLKSKGELLMKKSHYITGVVSSSDFGTYWPGYATVWMTDVENPSDKLEGYKIYKDANQTKWNSVAEIPFGVGDTIMLFADALTKYNTIYETTSGYYVSIIGKVEEKSANSIFKYAYGALDKGATKDGKQKFEVVLACEENEYSNAAHFIINSVMDKSLTGSYIISGSGADSSFVDGKGGISGSMNIQYVSTDSVKNTYAVSAKFQMGETHYTLDTTYMLKGWNVAQTDSFLLENDLPFYPEEGDTITCVKALRYARVLGDITSATTVWVKGFATGFQKVEGRTQQSVYMSDIASASNGIFEGYLCYTHNLDSIIKGDEILVKGNIMYFASKDLSEISKGNIYRIGGSDTKRPRTVNCVEVPVDAISVDSALAIGKALVAQVGQTVSTTTEYTVFGYIVDVTRQTSQDSASWYMSDTLEAYGNFKAYKSKIPTLIDEDDLVFVTGKISKSQLSNEEFSIEIQKGTANFACQSPTPTYIAEQVAAKEIKGTRKVMMNGQLFIVKEGLLYNAQGAVIR